MSLQHALIFFARAPVPGKAKTRLIPELGAEGAAELYRCFLLDTLARDCDEHPDVLVAVAEPAHLEPVRALTEEVCPAAKLIVQSGLDLGERMVNAFKEAFGRGYTSAVVIATDTPSLPSARVSSALALSDYRDLVIGPSLDGGYYLIGLRKVVPEFFRDVPWGSPAVLVQTLRWAQALGAKVSLLEPWYDVDTPQDLEVLRSHLTALHLAGDPLPCPRTWEFLQNLPEEA